MQAVQFDPKTKKLQMVQVPKPTPPGKYEVIVEVHYAGVCGTDIHIINGNYPCGTNAFTMGHEFCGIATDVGEAVTNVSRGDKVVVDPNSECGMCQACRSGTYQYCQIAFINNTIGIHKDGGMAQFCKVPANRVFRLLPTISLEMGALCEPLSCLAHGWDRVQPVAMGSHILVQGAGIIGVLWTSMLHHLGHRNILVAEITEARRRIVNELGLTGVRAVHPDEVQALAKQDPSWGVDVVVDCSGSAPAIEAAVPLLRAGGKLVIFGIANPTAKSGIAPFDIYKKELTIVGITANPFSFYKSMGFVDAMGEKYLNFNKLGIKVFKLNEVAEAVEAVKKGLVSKALFKIK